MNSLSEWVANNTTNDGIIVDVGCGDKRYSNYLISLGRSVITIDAWDKVNPDICLDVTKNDLPFDENSVDYIIMLDFIEHLEKQDGFDLIEKCKKVCKKSLLIFTPGWWSDNSENVNDPSLWCYGNTYDYHLSLWNYEDLNEFEFHTLNGFERYISAIWKKG